MLHSPAIAEWDNDYARVARVASQLRSRGLANRNDNNYNYYNNINNNNSTTTTTATGQQQQQLHQHLNRLDGALSTLPLAPAEIQRRRRLIHHLRGGTVGIASSLSSRTPNTMSSTTGGDGFSSMGGQQQQQQKQHPPLSHMATAMQQQDEMIDELAVGVSRLRDQTQVIGDEARMHVNLLGEMETNLAAAHCGLDEETKRAAKLKEDQSVWKLQLIVAGETILLVLLLFLGLSP
jgi:hypothetical protein